jgi:hypothetical protein
MTTSQGNTLHGVWGSSSSDVFAVGDFADLNKNSIYLDFLCLTSFIIRNYFKISRKIYRGHILYTMPREEFKTLGAHGRAINVEVCQ